MTDVTPAYYIAGTLACVGGMIGGLRAYYTKQRDRWTEEGATRSQNSMVMRENTEGIRQLTTTLGETNKQLTSLARRTENHDMRIRALENHSSVPPSNRPRSSRYYPAHGNDEQEERD